MGWGELCFPLTKYPNPNLIPNRLPSTDKEKKTEAKVEEPHHLCPKLWKGKLG